MHTKFVKYEYKLQATPPSHLIIYFRVYLSPFPPLPIVRHVKIPDHGVRTSVRPNRGISLDFFIPHRNVQQVAIDISLLENGVFHSGFRLFTTCSDVVERFRGMNS